ncbi:DUF4118 domain-containing protein [Thermoflexus sp.]|uniref:DUF4118 domain-containing protein n=1 Tax=Thermoflexus sp. TaxID=1969742 RepID=UPI0035E44CDC
MSDLSRPNPDDLLKLVQAEEQQRNRGKLKVFLGYAAGVGKTYAMLEAAHQRKREGVDVVVGYVETHGRPETEALLAGLEVLPRRQVYYRGILLTELDVDAVLARRPQLVLVDELAHTNAPGSRHVKRYQDVEEILEAGIDVYTTLNIQHLESLNDIVAQITGVVVRETVPDSVLEQAEIELVDLPPEELLVRLREGKVYVPEQAAQAMRKFFRKGNLTALRELAMRWAARRVDDQMRDYMWIHGIPGPWPAGERLLVGISPHPLAERLVRAARRLAGALDAEWIAVYVETPEHSELSDEQRGRVLKALRLAEELGGRSIILTGDSVPETLLRYAREQNVTKIILGKPVRPRWKEALTGSVADRIIRQSGNIDVYIISDTSSPRPVRQEATGRPPRPWTDYLWAICLVLIATGIGALLQRAISLPNLVIVYLMAVVIAALHLGRGPAILVSMLSVLALDFFFVPPRHSFAVSDMEYLLTFAGLLVVGWVISQLTARMRAQVRAAQRREAEMAALYAFTRDLSTAEGPEELLRAIADHIRRTFGREVAIFLPDPQGNLKLARKSSDFALDGNEMAVAVWSFRHGQPAGRGTDTLSAAKARYIPLKTPQGVVGVLGVVPKEPSHRLTPDQRRLLETFASEAALAIERVQLAEQARQAQLLQEAERLQTALLDSISHNLRTPLVSIIGALTSLQEDASALSEEARQTLVTTARSEAERLNRLVGNLLDMSRIAAGKVKVKKAPCEVQDVVNAALEQCAEQLKGRPITVKVDPNLPLVPMDFALIEQALVNVLDNAIKYSPAGSPIEIYAYADAGNLVIEVMDRGIGIPPEDLERVFDKFYRVIRHDVVGGSGLGLTISRAFIEAHGGRIWARNRPGGGTIITMTLPMEPTG